MKTIKEIPEGVQVSAAFRIIFETPKREEHCLMGTDSEIYSPVFSTKEELLGWSGPIGTPSWDNIKVDKELHYACTKENLKLFTND